MSLIGNNGSSMKLVYKLGHCGHEVMGTKPYSEVFKNHKMDCFLILSREEKNDRGMEI